MGMRADRASGSESDGRPRASERYPRTATCGCLFFVSPSSLYHLRSIRGLKRRKPRRDPLHSGRGSSPARGEAWVHRAESARAARYVGKRAERVRGRKGAADRPSASRATPHVYKGVSLSRPSFVSPTLSTHSRIQGTEYRGERLSTPGDDLLGRAEIPGCSEQNARDPLGAFGSDLRAQVAVNGPPIVLARLALRRTCTRVCLPPVPPSSRQHSRRIRGFKGRNTSARVSPPRESFFCGPRRFLCVASRDRARRWVRVKERSAHQRQ